MIGIVFSRDRAMQLDATLRSFLLHCQDAERVCLVVLYLATTPQHSRQYDLLATQYHQVQFVEERDFRRDLLFIMMSSGEQKTLDAYRAFLINSGTRISLLLRVLPLPRPDGNVLFLVDDNIVTQDFQLELIQNSLNDHPNALGFSLRLGNNTTHYYVHDKPQLRPELQSLPNEIKAFDWTDATGYFGYPLEVSSSVYRLSELVPLMLRIPFRSPNSLESDLSVRAKGFRREKPRLLCFESSVTFCAPMNMVQDEWENRVSRDRDYSSDKLADLFDQGYRIDVHKFSGFVPSGCHQEVELSFVRDENLGENESFSPG